METSTEILIETIPCKLEAESLLDLLKYLEVEG